MQTGGIVETGTHSELMAKDGAYAALYKVAAQSTDNHFPEAAPL
jgi:ABC-type multidrug transport system fused ATPase/permease subunit